MAPVRKVRLPIWHQGKVTFPRVLFFCPFAWNFAEAEPYSLAFLLLDEMSGNTCIIVFSEAPEGGSEPVCWWGDDPWLPPHCIADATGSTFTRTLCVSVCVCSPAHDKAFFPESHVLPLLFCQPNLKRARCGQKRPNVIVLRHKRCIVLGFCRLRRSELRLLQPHLFFSSWQMHARPFVLHELKTWMSISGASMGCLMSDMSCRQMGFSQYVEVFSSFGPCIETKPPIFLYIYTETAHLRSFVILTCAMRIKLNVIQ